MSSKSKALAIYQVEALASLFRDPSLSTNSQHTLSDAATSKFLHQPEVYLVDAARNVGVPPRMPARAIMSANFSTSSLKAG